MKLKFSAHWKNNPSKQTNFMGMIISERKKHTLRKPGKYSVGDRLELCLVDDNRNEYIFTRCVCLGTQDVILMFTDNELHISIDGRLLTRPEKSTFYFNEGFFDEMEFVDWFREGIINAGGMLQLELIHLTDLTY